MIVMKFGGTSVQDPEAVRRVLGVVQREARARLVVVSALSKVTDALVELARLAARGEATAVRDLVRSLRQRHEAMASLVRDPERRAELLGAAELAQQGRAPLARPIGDYVATQVAQQARSDLAGVRDLTGFARVLRQSFARLRRGGFRPEDVRSSLDSGLLGEVTRLYAEFRRSTERFYDEEDLYDAATEVVRRGTSPLVQDLGEIYVLPPGALSAGADALLRALRRAVGASHYRQIEPAPTTPETAFVLAPDPTSEARAAAREVLRSLEAGAGLHEIAVFHGADASYRSLLAQALKASQKG